jgi:ComF family protein
MEKKYLCIDCFKKIEFISPPFCRFCSSPIKNNKSGICKKCYGKNFPYDRVISVTFYKEPIKTLLHFFKYKNYDYLSDFFSYLIIEHLLKIGFNPSNYDLITSVPLHPLKLKEREYNQSSLLANNLANYFEIKFKDDIIYEKKYRVSQTKLKERQRKENVKNAFFVKEELNKAKLILIDDIFTTGATVKECAHILKEKGAEVVTIITLSKTQ